MVPSPSGKAKVCKTFIPGPNPGGTLNSLFYTDCFFVYNHNSIQHDEQSMKAIRESLEQDEKEMTEKE